MNFDYEFKFKAENSDAFVDLPFPQDEEGGFVWDMEEVCTPNTTRAEDADMNKQVIAKKRALTVKYNKLPHSQYAVLVKAIKGTGSGGTSDDVVYGLLTYPDVENWENPNSTLEVYTGNLSASYVTRNYDTGEIYVSTQVKFIAK